MTTDRGPKPECAVFPPPILSILATEQCMKIGLSGHSSCEISEVEMLEIK